MQVERQRTAFQKCLQPFENAGSHGRLQQMVLNACDNLPHLKQFIEQSGPAQAILAEHLKNAAQARPETRNDPQE
jgi:hypothetical protein